MTLRETAPAPLERGRERRTMTPLYRLNALLLRLPIRVVFRPFCLGLRHVPAGPFVLAPNQLGLYGGDTRRLVEYASEDESALEHVSPAGPDVWAQVRFAVEEEWAVAPEDVLWRRTTLGVRGVDGAVRDAVATRLARLLYGSRMSSCEFV